MSLARPREGKVSQGRLGRLCEGEEKVSKKGVSPACQALLGIVEGKGLTGGEEACIGARKSESSQGL